MKLTQKIQRFFPALDVVGAAASALCAIHCLAMPLLIVTLPAMGLGFLLSEDLERGFVVVSVLLAIGTTYWGFRVHRKSRVVWFSTLGAVFLLCATFGHSHSSETTHVHSHDGHQCEHSEAVHHHPQSTWGGLALLVAGAAFITSAHLLNRRFSKKTEACCSFSHV
jgi:hypothetical protein